MAYPQHLESFIREYLAARGAAVERTDYAVIDAIVDAELEKQLGKEHWQFAFDYDAAMETTGCEFITYGNAVLEKIVSTAVTGHKCSVRYCSAAATLPASLHKQIADQIKLKQSEVEIAAGKRYFSPVYRFKFKIAYLGDDREEQLILSWVDGLSAKVCGEYEKLPHIFYDAQPEELLPVLKPLAPEFLMQSALDELDMLTQPRRKAIQAQQRHVQEQDVARTQAYFSSMVREHEAKIAKSMSANDAESSEQTAILKTKLESIKTQCTHHIKDIEQKYQVRCEAQLIDVVLYMFPRWRLKLTVAARARKTEQAPEQLLFWDALLRKVIE
ncbi:MAG: hypothetical protein IT342_25545 [Candidatus Melainabacteria bacterium]|nr:hypothetical protein [Candidatus Melainabacteria bacterium]